MNYLAVLKNHTRLLSYVTRAMELASKVHCNHIRKVSKEPYINHCIRVANNPEVVEQGSMAICVALLHDCLEDTDDFEATFKEIKENFPSEVLEACCLLTHTTSLSSYEEYCKTLLESGNRLALVVKYADSLDNSIVTSNMSPERLNKCKIYAENSKKYLKAFKETFNEI